MRWLSRVRLDQDELRRDDCVVAVIFGVMKEGRVARFEVDELLVAADLHASSAVSDHRWNVKLLTDSGSAA